VTELAQALVGGILIGGLYVAISIGFSLSFGVLDVVDLAVGMWVVLGAFAVIVASDALGVDAFLLLPVVFIVFGAVGWLIAPLIYRVRTSKYALPALMGLAFTFGLATLIRGGLLTVFGYTPRTVHTDLISGNVELLGITAPMIRVAGFAFAVVATGLFLVDPGVGFPPGTPDALPDRLSWHGAVHAVAPPVAFGLLVGVCFVFARRFAAQHRMGWAAYCALTGVAALALVFWPGAGGSVRSGIAVVVTSAWMTATACTLLADRPVHRRGGEEPGLRPPA